MGAYVGCEGNSMCCGSCTALESQHVDMKTVESVSIMRPSPTDRAADFPTMCLSMAHLMKLERLLPHEVVYEKLVVPSDDSIVHFVSHEWLGFSEPDPDGTQLRRMQDIFQDFMNGKARQYFHDEDWNAFLKGVSAGTGAPLRSIESNIQERGHLTVGDLIQHVDLGYVWWDYHSIPQAVKDEQFLKAVNSIPNYVERCNYFWICAPSAVHAELQVPRNFASWRQRGWCRLEELANFLSRSLKMPLVVTNQPHLYTIGFLDGAQFYSGRPDRSVFNGTFTCCHFRHKKKEADGTVTTIPCDKDAIGIILRNLFDNCIQKPSKQQLFRVNVLQLAGMSMFAGYAPEEYRLKPDPRETVEGFLARIGYRSLEDKDALGWLPLVWAVGLADMKVVREIHKLRPAMLTTTSTHGMTVVFRNVNVAHDRFKELCSMYTPEELEWAVNLETKGSRFALDRAVKCGFLENATLIVEAKANIEARRRDSGCTPLLSAAGEGFYECCQMLLEHRANVQAKDLQGRTPLHMAVNPIAVLGNSEPDAKLKVIDVLLKARASLEDVDNAGRSPRQLAKELDFPEAVAALSVA